MYRVEYDADMEEPNCGRCSNCGDDDKYCIEYCGAEHAWARYVRYEWRE